MKGIPIQNCINHPDRKPFSVCHGCGKYFCESCLDEGEEFYYCKDLACQALLKQEKKIDALPPKVICPTCSSELELSDEDRDSRKFHCPECESFVDYTQDPPKVFGKKGYSLLLKTMNQSDIVVIKSLLDDSEMDYYVYDEEFLLVRPLVQPVRFFIAVDQLKEAQEVLKDFKFHIFGISSTNDAEA